MSIQDILDKFKGIYRDPELFLVVLIILVGLVSFGLGRNSAQVPSPTIQGVSSTNSTELVVPASEALLGSYVASKQGTKYHLPWCAGAQQMKEENKIWFTSKADATAAGYSPAKNCRGI